MEDTTQKIPAPDPNNHPLPYQPPLLFNDTHNFVKFQSLRWAGYNLPIPIFILENNETKSHSQVTIIPKEEPFLKCRLLQRVIFETSKVQGKEHPNLVQVFEVVDKVIFKTEELRALKSLDPAELAVCSWLDSITQLEATCIHTKIPSGHHFPPWADHRSKQDGKSSPKFIQEKVLVIQQLLEFANFAQEHGLLPIENQFYWKLRPPAIFVEEGDDNLGIKVKINLCDISAHQLQRAWLEDADSPITLRDLLIVLIRGCESIITNATELESLLIKNQITALSQLKLESKDYKLSKLISIIKEGTGAALEHLDFQEALGQGGFGVVLKAYDNQRGVLSAVKLLIEDPFVDSCATITLGSEVEFDNMDGLRHRNCAQVFMKKNYNFPLQDVEALLDLGDGKEENRKEMKNNLRIAAGKNKTVELLCIEMELCGPTLKSWLESGKRNEDPETLELNQLRIIHGLVTGLCILHEKNIIHRDLKPGNIFFSSQQEMFPIKIGDFGLSRFILGEEPCKKVGTAGYMAPEADCTKLSDIYSLGLVLWEVLHDFEDEKIKVNVVEPTSQLLKASNVFELVTSMTRTNVKERLSSLQGVSIVGSDVQPKNSIQLSACLEVFGPGSTISLSNGINYSGNFAMENDRVTLRGCSNRESCSRLTNEGSSVLTIKGNDCTISDLNIVSNQRTDWAALCIHGKRNTANNLTISGPQAKNQEVEKDLIVMEGVLVTGESTKMSNIHIKGFDKGLKLLTDGTSVDGITVSRCDTGVDITESSSIILKNAECSATLVGIAVRHCEQVALENLILIGMPSDYEGLSGAVLLEASYSSGLGINGIVCKGEIETGLTISWCNNTIVKDSYCESVEVTGCSTNEDGTCDKEVCDNVEFEGVDCGKSVGVSGCAKGINFSKCRGQEVVDWTMEGCGPTFGLGNDFNVMKKGKNEDLENQVGSLPLSADTTH